MATKLEKRLAAAARARAALGIEDTNDPSRVLAEDQPTPVPEPAGVGGGSDTDAQGPASNLMETGDAEDQPVVERPAIHPKHHPRKHAPGSLTRGLSVWYKGERYWVEFAPALWENGCYVRISDKRVDPNPHIFSGSDVCYVDAKGVGHGNVTSFCVHADLLALAPVTRSAYGPQPTLAGVARAERAKAGIRDVGDPVAVKLRECKTLDDVYITGAEYLGVSELELRAKYGKLNPGQQRMNIGNRMRNKWKKEQR